jgi:hypothetical protein
MNDETIITECVSSHEWIGQPTYCSACGVDKGNETMSGLFDNVIDEDVLSSLSITELKLLAEILKDVK